MLIVDDDAVDRMALRRALKATGLPDAVEEATDSKVAVRMVAQAVAEQAQYDCIFLDYNLPGQNGLALTKRLRAQGIKVPLIVLTGQGNEQTAVELMKAGASDYLSKANLSAMAIASIIRSAMRVYRAEMIVEATNRNLREKNSQLERQNRELDQQRQYIYKQNLQLQEVSRLKSEFLATMSHELRTPLNAIIGFSQILLSKHKGTLSEYQQNMMGRVLANGRNLLELINDILSFSKIEAGRLEMQPAELDMVALVSATVNEQQPLAAQKSLPLKVDLDLSNPIAVNDAVRLRQILVNLLSNAIKFTDEGYVQVRVSDRPSRQLLSVSGNRAELSMTVSDTGCGISAADQVDIFNPFHQADQKVTRQHAGTGLGLAITQSLVKMMGGDIMVESAANEGATFTVWLPRVVTAASAPHDYSSHGKGPGKGPDKGAERDFKKGSVRNQHDGRDNWDSQRDRPNHRAKDDSGEGKSSHRTSGKTTKAAMLGRVAQPASDRLIHSR